MSEIYHDYHELKVEAEQNKHQAEVYRKQMAKAEAEVERLKIEWSVMARACGNWRLWPGEHGSDHVHPDWLTAARAIIEREELKAFVIEVAYDRSDRVSGGLKEAARKLLSKDAST